MTFNPNEHLIILERKSKQKDGSYLLMKNEYLPVAWRLFWFRQENPKGTITSEPVQLEKKSAMFAVSVEREDGGSAKAHGSETAGDWTDYIEKAETKALGRALACLGYGTQFTSAEFEEGERVVDTPQAPKAETPPKQLDPELRARMNALYTRAKVVMPVDNAADFQVYLAKLLKVHTVDLATLQPLDLEYVERDLVVREAAAELHTIAGAA